MVGTQLLLLLMPMSSFLLVGWLLSLHHTATAFQPPRNYPRHKLSLRARKHILYTQQHAYQRISNETSALISSDRSFPSSNGDDETSLQVKFHEHITNMLNVKSQQKVLKAYNELLTMSNMSKKPKQQPPRHWNKQSERRIKLRGMFEIDTETSSSDVGTGELRWKGSVVQPSFDSYTAVANALLSTIVFRQIGGWEVCRLLEQLLAQVDRQSSDGGGDVEAVKECINANLIEALSKVGDGPSARQILYREKIARVQKQKEVERDLIEKEVKIHPRRKPRRNDVVVRASAAAAARGNATVAVKEGRKVNRRALLADKFETKSNKREQQQLVGEAAQAEVVGDTYLKSAETDVMTDNHNDDELDEGPQEVVTRASNALSYAKKIHNCYSDSQHDKQAAPKSLQLLKQMVNSLEERPHQLEPDMWIFNTVLLIWARSGRADSGQVAEEILDMMNVFGRNRSYSEFPYPNDQSYTFVIDAYANSGQKNSGKKALEILHQLYDSDWHPNARCLSTTIEAIFKAGDPIPLHLLKQMSDLNQSGDDSSLINSRTFTKAIVRGDAENALQVLDLLNDIGDGGVGPNVVHYNAAIFCLAKSDLPNRKETANELLKRMNEGGIKGNVVTYTAVLTAQDTYDEAERWLWRMEDKYGIAPTTRTYNACLYVLLNSGAENAIDRTFALLSRMEQRFMKGSADTKPDLVTYTSIANILRRYGSKEVSTARRQADWLIARVRQMGCEPDDIFDSAINQLRLGK